MENIPNYECWWFCSLHKNAKRSTLNRKSAQKPKRFTLNRPPAQKKRTIRRRKNKRSQTLKRKQIRKRKKSNKRHGGVGFRLDLSECPDGGVAHPIGYATNGGDMI